MEYKAPIGIVPLARLFIVANIICTMLVFPAGCQREKKAGGPPQPVEVTTVNVEPKDTMVTFEFVGQTESSHQVEIRSRVEGFLERRVYEEGKLVKAGQVMFEMDQKPFEAALQQARGELAQQDAKLSTAKANLARIRPLAEKNAISKKDLDDAIGSEQSAEAAVIASQGKVREAELNLSYTTIITPVTGLSSKAKQQDGSYISASNSLLTTVAQLDPIWVNFSVSENEKLSINNLINKNLLTIPKDYGFQIEVVLADGSIYPFKGRISFADPSFSTETGTFLVRATLANPKGDLRPGQFVRVYLKGAIRLKAILVPQRAVMQGAKSHFVWVVNKEGNAELRDVQVGNWHGDDWFIIKGLSAGDTVVVDGAIKLSAGLPVKIAEPAQKQSQNTDTTKSPKTPHKGQPAKADAPAKK